MRGRGARSERGARVERTEREGRESEGVQRVATSRRRLPTSGPGPSHSLLHASQGPHAPLPDLIGKEFQFPNFLPMKFTAQMLDYY